MSGVTNSRINGIHVNGTCRLRGSIDKLYSSIFIHRFRLFTFLDLFIHTIACIYLFTFPLFTHFPLFIYIFSQLQLPLYNPLPSLFTYGKVKLTFDLRGATIKFFRAAKQCSAGIKV